jgi:hypothetical protein
VRASIRIVCCIFVSLAAAHAGVSIVAPAVGISASSPVHVVAPAAPAISTNKITSVSVIVDGITKYTAALKTADTTIAMTNGNHNVTVRAVDSVGTVYTASTVVTVAPLPVIPSTATVFTRIEEMTSWASCDICSGAGGNGTPTPHWIAQNQTTPSQDGNSAQFHLDPAVSYASALWWRQLGPIDTATHFVYEANFYVTDSTAPQALEFDVNQSLGGYRYIFGTECDFKGTSHYWRVWDYTLHWQSTGIPCTPTTANGWHNVRWEFERTLNMHTRFVAITVDGVRTTVNRYYTPRPVGSTRELNVAVQLDGNKLMTSYSAWVDQVKLTAW